MAGIKRILSVLCGLLVVSCDVSKTADKSQSNALFNGLISATSDREQVSSNYLIQFPQDHGIHPNFAIEWWYLTANLVDKDNNQYPLQWTLFRFHSDAEQTTWAGKQQFMAHGKLASKQQQWFEERFARSAVGNVDVTSSPFTAFIDDWAWRSQSQDLLPATLAFTLNHQVSIKLKMNSKGPYILQGKQGYSQKSGHHGLASHYYSQPFIEVTGELTFPDKTIDVAGQAWFDHEWSSQLMDSDTLGWDWFSLHLSDGNKLMLFRMRHRQLAAFWSAKLMMPNGESHDIDGSDLIASEMQFTEVENKTLPLHWLIKIAKHRIDIQISPFKDNQWNPGSFPYYEGAVDISGTHTGQGFIELTGY
jgi:predicted secreted hydrolase